MARMRASADQPDLLAEQERSDFDAKAELLVDFSSNCLARVLAALDPAAGQTPWKIGAEHVLHEQHPPLVVEHRAHSPHGLTRRKDARDDAEAEAQHAGISNQR